MAQMIAWTCVVYILVLCAIALYARKHVANVEDFLVAGRRLSLPLSTSTLLATWFGAGTLLTVSDEIHTSGVSVALLDPLGAGLCLILAGLFFAAPLWNEKLLTLCDLFGRRFNVKVEVLTAIVMVPTYFGWIAVQYIALANMLHIFTGLDVTLGILLVFAVGTFYTLIGGLWSVTLTDFFQMVLIVLGLGVILVATMNHLSSISGISGLRYVLDNARPDHLHLFPHGTPQQFMDSFSLLIVGSIGNIPGQDLCQRIFASRSSRIAKQACIYSGILYLIAGLMPIFMGLSAHLILAADIKTSVIPAIVQQLLEPYFVVTFVIVLLSVVLSTIDSAILSPASVLAQNVISVMWPQKFAPLRLNQVCVLIVGSISVIVAFIGENAYQLLENAYEMQLVGLFPPLAIALFTKNWNAEAMYKSILTACSIWILHFSLGWNYFIEPFLFNNLRIPLPISIACTGSGFIVYFLFARYLRTDLSPDSMQAISE